MARKTFREDPRRALNERLSRQAKPRIPSVSQPVVEPQKPFVDLKTQKSVKKDEK